MDRGSVDDADGGGPDEAAPVFAAAPVAPPPPPPYVLQGTEDDVEVDPLCADSLRAVTLAPANGRALAPPPAKPLDALTEMQLALRRRTAQQQRQPGKGVSDAELKAAVDGIDDIRMLRSLAQQVAAVDEAQRVEALLPPGAAGVAGRFPSFDVGELRRLLTLDADVQRILVAAKMAKQTREQRLGELMGVPAKIKEIRARNVERFGLHLECDAHGEAFKQLAAELIVGLYDESFGRMQAASTASKAIGARFHLDKANSGLRDAIQFTKICKQHLDAAQAAHLEQLALKAESALAGNLRASSGSLGSSSDGAAGAVLSRSSSTVVAASPASPLFEAVESGDPQRLAAFTDAAEFSARNARGGTVLHVASARGDAPMVAALLARGMDPTLVNSLQWTPLHLACQSSLEAVRALLDCKLGAAALSMRTRDQETPLQVLCRAAPKHVGRNRALLADIVARFLELQPSAIDEASDDRAPLSTLVLKLGALIKTPSDAVAAVSLSGPPCIDFSPYLQSGALSDVTLILSDDDNMRLPVHRLVLCAQSAAFRGLLETSGMSESQNAKEVTLHDVTGDAMRALLAYLYGGASAVSIAQRQELLAVQLMALADRFLVPSLVAIVASRMARQLSHENAFLLFDATEPITIAHAQELRVAAAKMIVRDYGVLREYDMGGGYLKRGIEFLASRAAASGGAPPSTPAVPAYLK